MRYERVLVTGAGGFIGGHLVEYLKNLGYWVRGVDIKLPEYRRSLADEFMKADLRIRTVCRRAMEGIDEVYHLAADMGGMGFISKEHVAPFYNSNLMDTYTIDEAVKMGIKKYFFSSSACVYPTHRQQDKIDVLHEPDVVPANPNEAYGWEKLMHELRLQAYASQTGIKVRVARFENTYGPYGTYDGGREKVVAALCRKAILAKDGEELEVWGDGLAARSFLYVSDLVDGIYKLMQSDIGMPVNLGSDEVITINELAKRIIRISGKNLRVKHVDGPQGVRNRYVSHSLVLQFLGWEAKSTLDDGLRITYEWIRKQIEMK